MEKGGTDERWGERDVKIKLGGRREGRNEEDMKGGEREGTNLGRGLKQIKGEG